jgi:TonB family protein
MLKSFCVACLFVLSSIFTLNAQHTVTMVSGEIMVGEVRALKDGMVQFFFKGNEMNISTSKIKTISFVDDMGGNVEQTSSTKGVTYVMPGRKMIKEPKIDNLTMEKGVVVVEITINKYGNVVKAVPGIEGSTTTSKYLNTKAMQAAESVKFDTSPVMPIEQKGTITIVF